MVVRILRILWLLVSADGNLIGLAGAGTSTCEAAASPRLCNHSSPASDPGFVSNHT